MEEEKTIQSGPGKTRTIITNAVYGSHTQTCNTTVYIRPSDNRMPTRILGCTLKDAQIKECSFEEIKDSKVNVRVNGIFEVHVWYEANSDTHVAKSHEKFSQVITVECLGGESYRNKRILAWISQKPASLGTMIVNKGGLPSISIQVEYGLGVEVLGEAMLNVVTYQLETGEKKEQEEPFIGSLKMFDADQKIEDTD